jgi:hypothetical protein
MTNKNKNTAMVRYQPSKSLAVGALNAMVQSKGEDWVYQQIANGVLHLSGKAMAWWTARMARANSTSMISVPAPTNVGVALKGNAKLNGSTRIKHRELIAHISGTSMSTFRVNPIDGQTFPYLSTIAAMYDKYIIHSLRVVVVSGVPTTSGGRWYLAWDPDSSDQRPEGSAAMMAMQHSASMSSWQSGTLAIPRSTNNFIAPFVDSLKDHGQFHFQFYGVSSPATDLFVEYDISLLEPNVTSPNSFIGTAFDTLIETGLISNVYGSEIVKQLLAPTPKKFMLAPGKYLIDCFVTASSITPGSWTIASDGNDTSIFQQRSVLNSPGTQLIRKLAIKVGSRGAIVTIGDAYGALTADKCYLTVAPVSESALQEASVCLA